ncbi:Dihydrofolate reductase [Paracholeplasma brassicae]|uniref:dihydrofolate reductase n=1 Tax=Acholeplasma brassicae TaxID=61635 RepID=U4KNH0_9MOLU|nr:dihydrofolate reductase [Paracholeplasma brassicae]CCV65801.1 Dihydrofolate reductase [Paracholeplasma brassicae]
MISLIWAMDRNWLIGKDNILPWHYKKDLIYFKNHTKGKTVLMGEMTYLSLKGYYKDRPLPFGKIYVASLNNVSFDGCIMVNDLKGFLKETTEDVIVIGGKTVYQIALEYADYLYITWIDKDHEGNVFFPKFDLSMFKVISENQEDELRFTVYERG